MASQNVVTESWNRAADALESDVMRLVRYKKCIRYFLDLDRQSKIVEVGCGEGSGLRLLKDLGFRRLFGVEVSIKRLQRARNKIGGDIPLLLVSPTGGLPLKTGSVDAVVSAAVIEHTVDPRVFVHEMARIVCPGGYVVISSDCYSWRILQLLGIYRSVQPIDRALFPTTLFRYFRESGLQVLSCEGFPLPGQEFRFLKLLAQTLLMLPKSAIQRLIPAALKLRVRSILPRQRRINALATDAMPTGPSLMWETWPQALGISSFLKLLFSDENVFFLTK